MSGFTGSGANYSFNLTPSAFPSTVSVVIADTVAKETATLELIAGSSKTIQHAYPPGPAGVTFAEPRKSPYYGTITEGIPLDERRDEWVGSRPVIGTAISASFRPNPDQMGCKRLGPPAEIR